MKTYVVIYDGFVHFEVVLACYLMKSAGKIITVSPDEKPITSYEGFKTVPHMYLKDVNPDDVDLFIIPGGDPSVLMGNTELYSLLQELNKRNKAVAAICAAPVHLASAGVIKNRRFTTTLPLEAFEAFNGCIYENSNFVVDGNILTAKANAYVDFALEAGRLMNIYKDEADFEETVKYFKYFDSLGQ